MKSSEKAEFVAVLGAAATIHDKKLTAESIEMYWQALKDLSLEAVKKGISRHLNDPDRGQFMVKPADIRRHLQGSTEHRALRAWSQVEQAIFKNGPYRSVVFSDQIISQVISELGGWPYVCNNADQWMQKEFVARYEGYIETRLPKGAPVKLLGIHERQNTHSGFESPPGTLALVGDPEQAKALLEAGQENPETREGAARFLAKVREKAEELEQEEQEAEPEEKPV